MPQCQCLTQKGKQCIRKAVVNSQYCLQHRYCSQSIVKKKLPRQLNALSGPSTFLFFKNLEGKRILLLGEAHDTYGICTTNCQKGSQCPTQIYEVHEWLSDLAKNAPQCLDIFVEQDYQTNVQTGGKPLGEYGAPIEAVSDQFKICNNVDKTSCYSQFNNNLRYHYIDLRPLDNLSQLDYWMEKYPDATYSAGNEMQQYFYDHRQQIFDYAFGYNEDGCYYNVFLTLIGDQIKHQFDDNAFDVEDSNKFRQTYLKYIKKQQSKTNNASFILSTLYEVYMESNEPILKLIFNIPMELYFLHRFFIIFDEKKLERGPKACWDRQFKKIINSIIYVGDAHAQIYKQFFLKLSRGLIRPDIDIVNDYSNKCIQLNQPFDFFA